MGLFERYLTVWVALAIFAGMGAGAIAPDLFASAASDPDADYKLALARQIKRVAPMAEDAIKRR